MPTPTPVATTDQRIAQQLMVIRPDTCRRGKPPNVQAPNPGEERSGPQPPHDEGQQRDAGQHTDPPPSAGHWGSRVSIRRSVWCTVTLERPGTRLLATPMQVVGRRRGEIVAHLDRGRHPTLEPVHGKIGVGGAELPGARAAQDGGPAAAELGRHGVNRVGPEQPIRAAEPSLVVVEGDPEVVVESVWRGQIDPAGDGQGEEHGTVPRRRTARQGAGSRVR